MRKNILILCVMIPILVIMTDILMKRSQVSCLSENTCETAEFREQHLSGRLYEELSGSGNFEDDLTVTMLHGNSLPMKYGQILSCTENTNQRNTSG